ncbi:LSU ribosomal protein L29P [Desulfurococcus mucosus DSM 2162]|uniref:Large ribosomal subunit protein uL29 n=1 Tax=Desulfurococcus mucosus (strain ATCC 35584 / DSM 2162 / JCM 9187 / O7/1) TaxID=765177 RepID=E8RAN3_DESM0|nr:50S ribosomal protein L29 [Desulfurococcus mucosus]ADV65469.1 LSU ribosomal protein L29P [Desulfurococcus mucosus DSM 2162]
MRADEIRKMTPEERLRKLNELRLELVKLRLQSRTGTLTNTARIRNVKRDIARILTVMKEAPAEESSPGEVKQQ